MYNNVIFRVFGGGIFIGIFFLFAGSMFLKERYHINFSSILITIAFFFLIGVNYILFDNALKMMSLYIVVLFVYKAIYKSSITQSAIASLISYLMLVIGELLFITGVSIAMKLRYVTNMNVFVGDFISNLLINIFASLLVLLIYKAVRKWISNIKEKNKIILIFTSLIILTSICLIFYKLLSYDWQFDEMFILNSILIICIAYIAFILIKQQIDKAKISDDYEKAVEYSIKSEKLIERYSISQHENKNELIIIKSMVHKNNKRLLDYLNEIIKEKDNIEDAWIRFLRYLPFGGVKGIIHNKISEMKSQGIEVFLDISKAIEKSFLKDLNVKENNQITKIIGVFLDNAKEAAVEAEEKKVTILIYMDKEDIVFEIANTYIGNVDIEKIYEVGLTTKGKNHGYGLPLVKGIIESNNRLQNETKIIDNCFVQRLKIFKQ